MKKQNRIKQIARVLLTVLAVTRLTSGLSVSAVEASQTFTVPVRLEKAAEPGALSMGNQAMGQTATVVETETGASIYISFSAMTFSGLHGHLTKMYAYEGGSLTEAAVTDTVTDTGVDGKEGVFPSGVVIHRSSLREEAIKVRVRVDAMDAIVGSEGAGEQDATLILNYASAPESLAAQAAAEAEAAKAEAAKAEAAKAEAAKAEAAKAEAAKAEAAKAEAAKAEAAKAEAAKAEAAKAEETKSETAKPEEAKKETATSEEPKTKLRRVEDYFTGEGSFAEGAYLIDVSGRYLNPLDGLTADGGTKNAGIGEGMVDGVVTPSGKGFSQGAGLPTMESGSGEKYAKALLQKTKNGTYFATLRLHLMNFIKRDQKNGPFIRLLQKDGSFTQIDAKETAEHIETYADSYVDYRFSVEDPHFLAQIEMFVEPMARPVTFFVESHPEKCETGHGDFTLTKEETAFPIQPVIGIGVGVVVVIAALVLVLLKRKGGRVHE